MKALCFILALYTVVLSVHPCNDDACSEQKATSSQDVQTANEHSDDDEACSPFCICSCCASRVQLASVNIVLPPSIDHNTKFVIPYQEKPTLSASHAIWQPPRLL